MFFCFSRAVLSYLITFCTEAFCITLTYNAVRSILQHVSFCQGHCLYNYIPLLQAVFVGPTLYAFFDVLKKLKKDDLDILRKCLDITAVVTKLKNVLSFPLLLTFFGVFDAFCSMFLKYQGTIENFHTNFCLLSFFFQNIKQQQLWQLKLSSLKNGALSYM